MTHITSPNNGDAELLAAADAVVERWHSRDWKQPHTRDFIDRLSAAVGAVKAARRSPVADAAGELAELPEPDHSLDGGSLPFYTAEQVRQVQRDSMAAGRAYQRKVDEKIIERLRTQLARTSAPEGAPVEVTNPERAKWNTKQWYEHVGAWETPEGFISFGSVMAVRAMLLQFQRAMYPALSYPTFQHPDDAAVDRFATAMKDKMAASRAKGRNGWDNEVLCSAARLQTMLVEHLTKGDPIDVGNFAMMLWNRGEPVAAPTSASAQPADQNNMEKNDE